MKKLIMVVAIVATIGGFAIASGQNYTVNGQNQGYNQNISCPGQAQGYGQGHRYGKGRFNSQLPCNGQGYAQQRQSRGFAMAGQRMMRQQGNIKQLTEKEVKAEVENVINNNFKGLKIVSIDKFNMPRGLVYTVNVEDKNGKKSIFHVNPYGNVVGPFAEVK